MRSTLAPDRGRGGGRGGGRESDTFITTCTAIDPPRTADATVALDGFFGWPRSALAS
jgi:hypothetical protein